MLYYHHQTEIVIEESMKINRADLGMLLFLEGDTYHIHLSSITIIFYNITLYE